MIRVTVLYPQTEGARFDWDYYLKSHLPMVGQRLGVALKSVAVEQGISGQEPASAPPYAVIANLTFESVTAFQTAFGPHAQEIVGDVAKFTSITPVIQISELKVGS